MYTILETLILPMNRAYLIFTVQKSQITVHKRYTYVSNAGAIRFCPEEKTRRCTVQLIT